MSDRFNLRLVVLGVPVPKGSGKAVRHRTTGKPIYLPANEGTRPWQALIASECHLHMGSQMPFAGPVEIQVVFFMPRPKSAPKKVTEPITSKNDIDKLLRTILDGLVTGGGIADDGQVIHIAARKAFAGGIHDPLGPAGLPRAAVMVIGVQSEGRVA